MSDNVNNMNKDQLEALQVQKEAEYQMAMESLSQVELRDVDLSRQITEIQLERRRLATAMIQGKFNLRRVSSELRVIKTLIYKRLSGN